MSIEFRRQNGKSSDNTLTLDSAELGKRYIIKKSRLQPDIKLRFAEMGLTPTAEVTVVKKAPLGDPLEISVRGYSLCIRAKEAKLFEVDEVTHE